MPLSEQQRKRYQQLKQRGFGGNANLKPNYRTRDPYETTKELIKREAVKEIKKNGQQSILRGKGKTYEDNLSMAKRQERNARSFDKNNSDTRERIVRNNLMAGARQIRKDSSLRGNDYQYGTKKEVDAQHNARYRNIRKAFGMSAG